VTDHLPDDQITDAPRSVHLSRRLALGVSGLLVLGVIAMGLLVLRNFNHALQPELDRRASLIGATIRDDTQRALELGIPLRDLVGVEDYFAVFLTEFDELDYLALRDAEDASLVAIGRTDGQSGGGPDWRPITSAGMTDSVVHTFELPGAQFIEGQIEVGVDSGYVRSKLDDLALDVIVILIVALVIAFEVTLAVSRRLGATGHERGDSRAAAGRRRAPGDFRIVLLVFAIAEELNKSFLPLFIKAAHNPIPSLDTSIVISLPIVSFLLTMAIVSLFAGRLLRALGQRRLIIIGMSASAASHLGMVFADDVMQIVGLRALTGVGYALATVAGLEYLLERLSPGNRTRSIGVFVTVVMGGTFAGTALGGIFADRLGVDAVFLISFGLVVVAALAATLIIEPDVRDPRSEDPSVGLADVVSVLKERSLLQLLAGVTVPMNLLMAAFLWYLVPLTLAEGGAGASVIARTLMIYYLVILVGGSVAGRLAGSRFQLWPFVGVGSVISAAVLLLPAVAPSTLTIAFAVLGVGLGHAAIRGPQIALALEIAESELPAGGRDAAMAAMRSLERLGSLVGLLAVSVVAAAFGLATAIGAVGVAGLIAGSLFLARRPTKRELIDA
jgi:predicted MFS family arabinose efflux permease